MEYTRALTIAGSDSGGGAGIQADIKTMSALGVYASSVITAVTVQNTVGVKAVHTVPADIISGQIHAVMEDIKPKVVKIGMLSDVESMRAVADALNAYNDISIILDPVMVATSGDVLMQSNALSYMKQKMLPHATLVTPNIPEAEALAGINIASDIDADKAASIIAQMGAEYILIKGGHKRGIHMTDRLYHRGSLLKTYSDEMVETPNTHGTGCTLSSAITSYLALGKDMQTSVLLAKVYISQALRAGALIEIGSGHGPVNHFFSPKPLNIR